MSEQATKLKEQPGGTEVDAVVHDLLTLDALFTAEEQWCMERIRVLRALAGAHLHDSKASGPQSVHWSWARKAASCVPSRLDAFGDVRLFGVEAMGKWQALLFGLCEGYGIRHLPGYEGSTTCICGLYRSRAVELGHWTTQQGGSIPRSRCAIDGTGGAVEHCVGIRGTNWASCVGPGGNFLPGPMPNAQSRS